MLAALCLADEPNVSYDVASDILAKFVEQVTEEDGRGGLQASIDRATVLLTSSHWKDMVIDMMVKEFMRRKAPISFKYQGNIGGLCALAVATQAPSEWEETWR